MDLSCFKAYDIRGEISVNFDANICHRVGYAIVHLLSAHKIVLGWDARGTSKEFADAVAFGVMNAGADVIDIGLAGTEEMYWAVNEFSSCGGIMVTASHNPISYNGLKIVKSGSRPLDPTTEFLDLRQLVETLAPESYGFTGKRYDLQEKARAAYVQKVVSLFKQTKFSPLKIVVNSGNGAAGPTFDAIAENLLKNGCLLNFVRVHHDPNPMFPNGIPNPILEESHSITAQAVLNEEADFGVAFDGDFDRCVVFDELGRYVSGEHFVGLLADIMLQKSSGSQIVHDPRVTWNIEDIISEAGGVSVISKIGHAFFKFAMRENDAVYGGEFSGHHYFRDFAYCDSGMIPWLLVAEYLSGSGAKLSTYLTARIEKFISSGERNFLVKNSGDALCRIVSHYASGAINTDKTDGFSFAFDDWRMNVRCARTEPFLRLNVETRGDVSLLDQKLAEVSFVLREYT